MAKIFHLTSKFFNSKLFYYFIIVIFILLTFPKMLHHNSFMDEGHAWLVSYHLNFNNALILLKQEGHGIIWWLILSPFSKNSISYPYSMLIINWLFALSALIVFLFKAPFNNLYKTLFSFSFMMLSYFSIVARCYSIGLLLIFILAYLYKKSDTPPHPILYSLLLGITANTSAMAAIASGGLAFLFLFDLFKNKDYSYFIKFLSLFIILIFNFLFLYPILIYINGDNIGICGNLIRNDLNEFIIKNLAFLGFSNGKFLFFFCYLFCLIYILFFNKDIKAKIYLIVTTLTLFMLLTFFYSGEIYHRYFYIIFIIISLWISNKPTTGRKIIDTLFLFSFFVILFTNHNVNYEWDDGLAEMRDFFNKNASKFENSIVYIPYRPLRDIFLPYLSDKKSKVNYFVDYSENDWDNYNFNIQGTYNIDDNNDYDRLMQVLKKQNKPVYLMVRDNTDKTTDKNIVLQYKDLKIYKIKSSENDV